MVAILSPSGAQPFFTFIPTAYAVGCILAPLRGCTRPLGSTFSTPSGYGTDSARDGIDLRLLRNPACLSTELLASVTEP